MFGLGKNKDEEEAKTVTVATTTDDVSIATPSKNQVTTDPDITATTDGIDEIDGSNMPAEPPPLTWKEAKALKKSKYATEIANNEKYTKMYIIRNKRTNQVVELRARDGLHAACIIGWRPRHVRVLDVKTIEKPVEEPQTVASSTGATDTGVIEPKSE